MFFTHNLPAARDQFSEIRLFEHLHVRKSQDGGSVLATYLVRNSDTQELVFFRTVNIRTLEVVHQSDCSPKSGRRELLNAISEHYTPSYIAENGLDQMAEQVIDGEHVLALDPIFGREVYHADIDELRVKLSEGGEGYVSAN